jgi:hypothetical protein
MNPSPIEPAWVQWTRIVDLAYRTFEVLREELVLSRVGPMQMQHIVSQRYDRTLDYYSESSYIAQGLFAWEERAITEHFPAPPARVLLGGAGCGRELFALQQRGYQVDAMEPAENLFQRMKREADERRLVPAPRLLMAGYEELVQGQLREFEQGERFDAVVLGWGSITHVPSPEVRQALLQATARLCPRGPVLLSFSPRFPVSGSRAETLRGWLRPALMRLPGAHHVATGDSYNRDGYGYEHSYSGDEIQELARAAGYTVALLSTSGPEYPHAVLKR